MMRRLLQPFWVLLAIVFLIEAWLWITSNRSWRGSSR